MLAGVQFDAEWGGPLAIPRLATSDHRRRVGDHGGELRRPGRRRMPILAGKTVRDLVLGVDSDLVHLPWVGHRVRKWEPEPLRWVGGQPWPQTHRIDRPGRGCRTAPPAPPGLARPIYRSGEGVLRPDAAGHRSRLGACHGDHRCRHPKIRRAQRWRPPETSPASAPGRCRDPS